MNTVKSRLFSLADLKEFISLDVEEDYPKMLKKKKNWQIWAQSDPSTI